MQVSWGQACVAFLRRWWHNEVYFLVLLELVVEFSPFNWGSLPVKFQREISGGEQFGVIVRFNIAL
jgi:hypothetical protein